MYKLQELTKWFFTMKDKEFLEILQRYYNKRFSRKWCIFPSNYIDTGPGWLNLARTKYIAVLITSYFIVIKHISFQCFSPCLESFLRRQPGPFKVWFRQCWQVVWNNNNNNKYQQKLQIVSVEKSNKSMISKLIGLFQRNQSISCSFKYY